MEEMKPARCRARARARLYLVLGREVRPRRAREAFWRCEHMLVICWMPILKVGDARVGLLCC